MLIYFYPSFFYISLILLALVLVVIHPKGRNPYHTLFSAILGCYLIGALSVAVFPFAITKPTDNLHLSINLIPFDFGNCFEYLPQKCAEDIFNNILLTIPFGFGIHFVARLKPRALAWVNLLIGCALELTQLIMVVVFRVGFRAIDINDVIFNTLGAFIGYLLFKLFGWLYETVIRKYRLRPKHIFAYIHQITASHIN